MRYLHTMVRISDVDASLHSNCDLLGLEPAKTTENEKGRFTNYFLCTLSERERHKPHDRPHSNSLIIGASETYTGGQNFGHLAYRVDNIYDLCERLIAAEVTINTLPQDENMAFVQSPDGISNELLREGGP